MTPATLLFASLLFLFSQVEAQASAAQNATVFALLYGYPLIAFQKVAPSVIALGGVNRLLHARVLKTAADREVVKPNVDTLYSTLIFDLSENDLVITIPEKPRNRFALFSYYDVFGDNFANTGTGNVDKPGDYLLRRSSDAGLPYGVRVVSSNTSSYQAYINSPTTHGIFLIRWLVQNASVYNDIYGWQNETKVTPAPRFATSNPTLLEIEQQEITGTTPADTALRLLAVFNPANPPELVSSASTVATNLFAAGIDNGTYTPRTSTNLTQANTTALLNTALAFTKDAIPLNNGWSMVTPNQTGDFRNNFALRTAIAAYGFLMLKAPNAIYPSWANISVPSLLGSTEYSLGAHESYLFTFSAKPPLVSTGFWSLTAYADNYLIPNKRNVYALGDRSNLTYGDGERERVYGAGSTTVGRNFQILVQPADVAPPRNWTDNWLPGPSGGGNVSLLLRWYGAASGLTNGSYVYPVVTRQGAFIA